MSHHMLAIQAQIINLTLKLHSVHDLKDHQELMSTPTSVKQIFPEFDYHECTSTL
jgi:hypothetical protein